MDKLQARDDLQKAKDLMQRVINLLDDMPTEYGTVFCEERARELWDMLSDCRGDIQVSDEEEFNLRNAS